MRAYLTVTADRLDAALACEADAWILVATRGGPTERSPWFAGAGADRADVRKTLDRPPCPLHLRLGSVDGPDFADGLARMAPHRPAAILLPVRHGRDVAHAGARLAVHEAEQGWPDGATRIIALIAGAAGTMAVASLAGSSPRLAGIGWDAAALARELGSGLADDAGAWVPSLAHARAMVRLGAAAAGVAAIEAACPSGLDAARHAHAARRDGFAAVFAATPAEVAAIRTLSAVPAV